MALHNGDKIADFSAAPKEAFVFPPSFGQRRLWFLNKFDPDSPAYNIPIPIRCRALLNRSILERTVNELVRRHEVLRTTFRLINGEPMQVIAPSLHIAVAYSDLRSTMPADQIDEAAGSLAALDAQRPFSLADGPLFRVGLHRLGEADFLLLLSMHHIVSDGWSVNVLFRELSALYAAFSMGKPSPLPELGVQYADFAHWQAQTLTGQPLQKLLAYWKQHLAGAPELLRLPTDKARPSIASGRGGAHGIAIDASLYRALRAFCQREGVTPFMALLTLFNVLIYRHTGEMDIVVGTPIANRRKPQLEDLIGLFVNTLVMRTDLSGEPSVRELLARVREVALGAYSHQDMPFELLVEELQPSRSLSYNPLFQVMFILQSADAAQSQQTEPNAMQAVNLVATTAKFDFTVSFGEVGESANLSVEYNADLFEHETITRLVDRFIVLIDSAVAEPEQKISALPLCRPSELRMLQAIVGAPNPQFVEQSIGARIAALAMQQPDQAAITAAADTLSYRQLDARADRLALKLLALGIAKGDKAWIYLDMGIDAVVSMLALAKVGAVFIPIEPHEPILRTQQIFSHTSPDLIVSNRHFSTAHDWGNVRLCLIDQDSAHRLAAGEKPTLPQISADDPAYVLYCPDDAGAPLGVTVKHGALIRSTFSTALAFEATDRIVHCVHSHDAFSVFEVFASLSAGAHWLYIPVDPLPPPRKLANLFKSHAATIAILPIAVLEKMARNFPRALKTIRAILLHDETHASGEAEINDLTLQEKCFYVDGGAEVGGYSLIRAAADSAHPDALGISAAGVTAHLLDGAMNPTPVGAVGEIYIESSYLALGYLNNPVATARSFVNKHPAESGVLYRSGQLARREANGELTAYGRCDRRLLIGGVRVQPQEVEATLLLHPAIDAVAVVPRPAGGLAAYVVGKNGQALAENDLTLFLRDRVFAEALPSIWRFVNSLPLTPRGLTDIDLLHRRENASGADRIEYVAPRNATETQLAELWSSTLGKPQIGVHDDFFELGGHSLLVTRVVAHIADEFGSSLSLKSFFASPTVAGLALLIEQAGSGSVITTQSVIPSSHRNAQDSAIDVENLSDEDVNDLLAKLLQDSSSTGAV